MPINSMHGVKFGCSGHSAANCIIIKITMLSVAFKACLDQTLNTVVQCSNSIHQWVISDAFTNSCHVHLMQLSFIDQWEKALHSNASSHWLSLWPEWSIPYVTNSKSDTSTGWAYPGVRAWCDKGHDNSLLTDQYSFNSGDSTTAQLQHWLI